MKKFLLILAGIALLLELGLVGVFGYTYYKSIVANTTPNPDNILSDNDDEEDESGDETDDKQPDNDNNDETLPDTPVNKGQNDPNEFFEKQEIIDNGNDTPQPVVPTEIPYFVRVNRKTNCITIYGKDASGNYTVPVKAMICSTGLDNGTPLGVFKTSNKYVWRQLFHDVFGQYATRVTGHILFHSVPYSEAKKDALLSEEYNKLGEQASAGCIRLSVEDAKWIYDNCPSGTTVEIYEGDDLGPLGKPESIFLDLESEYAVWDPTDPDENNPWKTALPILNGVINLTVERASNPDLFSHVSAVDYNGKELPFTIEGEYDLNVCGTYNVTYTVVNAVRNTATVSATITVQDTIAPTITQNSVPVVYPSSENISAIILSALTVVDSGDSVDPEHISIDITQLENAMTSNAYGTYTCYVTAVDLYGNHSQSTAITVDYKSADALAPTITLTGVTPEITLSLSDITEESARLAFISAEAQKAVIYGTHFTVADDISATENIDYTLSCDYQGSTAAGTYQVEVVITATDESGKTTQTTISVTVIIVE